VLFLIVIVALGLAAGVLAAIHERNRRTSVWTLLVPAAHLQPPALDAHWSVTEEGRLELRWVPNRRPPEAA
jgi:hypothetical protein